MRVDRDFKRTAVRAKKTRKRILARALPVRQVGRIRMPQQVATLPAGQSLTIRGEKRRNFGKSNSYRRHVHDGPADSPVPTSFRHPDAGHDGNTTEACRRPFSPGNKPRRSDARRASSQSRFPSVETQL